MTTRYSMTTERGRGGRPTRKRRVRADASPITGFGPAAGLGGWVNRFCVRCIQGHDLVEASGSLETVFAVQAAEVAAPLESNNYFV